jgi:histidinol-phosphate aminotransferase
MADIKKLVRENVLRLTPYSCARDEFQGDSGIFLDANENPFGDLNRYPDPYQKELKKAVSEFRGIPVENIFLGNGSDEIIDLCFRVFCNPGTDKALLFPPTYGMYEVSAAVNDIETVKVPLTPDFQIDTISITNLLSDYYIKLVFICSPNNPTGNAMKREDVEFILDNFNGIVVIDEAYIDFSEKKSYLNLIGKYNNLIVMQTFSKALGMAAVRLGIAYTNQEIVSLFNRIKPPYNISTINQKAGLEKLGKQDAYKSEITKIKAERERLRNVLQGLEIVEKVYPTDANFMLIKVPDANSLYNYLVERKIIVRNRNSIIRNCIRITVGTKEENGELINALEKYDVPVKK